MALSKEAPPHIVDAFAFADDTSRAMSLLSRMTDKELVGGVKRLTETDPKLRYRLCRSMQLPPDVSSGIRAATQLSKSRYKVPRTVFTENSPATSISR